MENRLVTKQRSLNEMDNSRVKIETELDEWRSQLNACKTEMGLNSSASLADKKAINQCNRQIQLQEEAIYQKVCNCLHFNL